MSGILRDKKGKFKRTNNPWTPANTEDGYNRKGWFMVYLPDHPRANSLGYVPRAAVHYEYFNNDKLKKGEEVHHKDKNRLNDTKENLIKLVHQEHSKLHNKEGLKDITQTCVMCKKPFLIKQWRLNQGRLGKYCSQKCYQQYRNSNIVEKICIKCNKKFFLKPYQLKDTARKGLFCSQKCYTTSLKEGGRRR